MTVFFITTLLSNYADDNSLYDTGKDRELVKSVLVNDFRAVKEWFYQNFVIVNPNNVTTTCALEKILKVMYLNLKMCV